MADFDVIVLGGGPGGYLAAERLGRAGKSVALIEQASLGGTCLNVGCIPTKALLNCAKLLSHAQDSAQFGIQVSQVGYDWGAMQAWKAKTVKTLVAGVTQLMRRHRVQVVTGHGRMVAPGVVEVDSVTYSARDVIIATGSAPVRPPIPGAANNPLVVDSTALLNITEVPERLTIVGGGVIGIEFASLFSRLGTTVTIVEMLDEILAFAEPEVASRLRASLKGVTVKLGARVTAIEEATVVIEMGGTIERVEADLVLMAIGRRPLVDGWGADEIDLAYTSAGVTVDDQMRTNLAGVWAVGDVTGRSLLAHGAYRMGEVAASAILDGGSASRGPVMRWDTIPWALYGAPEAAGVGLTQAEGEARGLAVQTVTVPLAVSGRFVAEEGLSRAGVVKVVADRDSRLILGVQLLGPYAPEMIWGAAAVLEMELTIDEVRQLVFPHPTISEGIREACWAFPDQERV
ncbi:MAG: dihydrolipoyl dehydrogenase [Propionibacteriaceae bacterium]|jgi:dihydrolipoamide dehydrogenase|nr:dihydrolipoyl dehydrogenase [Propionibacteriaceae bacterium]